MDDVPELANLPWELLLDSAGDKFVAQSAHTPIVRYLDMSQGVDAAAVRPPLQVLVMVASPIDHHPLDVEHEKALLEKALAPLKRRGMVTGSSKARVHEIYEV